MVQTNKYWIAQELDLKSYVFTFVLNFGDIYWMKTLLIKIYLGKLIIENYALNRKGIG